MPDSPIPPLDDYQSYLLLLASAQVDEAPGARIDPQDAVQETLTKAQARWEQFRGRTSAELAGWLRTILANHLTDAFRRKGRELDEQALARRLEQSSVRLGELFVAEQSSPSRQVAQAERLTALADALVQLSDDQRLAIELRHLKGLSLAEIAQHMHRTKPAVGGLLQRGLKTLRENMNDR